MTKNVVTFGKVTLMGSAAVIKLIDALAGKREAYQGAVHEAAVQALGRYAYDGDLTLVLRLMGGWYGKKGSDGKYVKTSEHPTTILGTDRGWLIDWLARFSDLRFNAKGMLYRINPNGATYTTLLQSFPDGKVNEYGKAVDMTGAINNPFWTLDKAAANGRRNQVDFLNIMSIAMSAGKRIENAVQANDEDADADTYVADQLEMMRGLAAALAKTTEDFIKANGINVADLEAQRLIRKQSAASTETVAANDVVAPKAGEPVADAV